MPDPGVELRDVPRETIDRLLRFEELVRKWSPSINLVAPADLADLRSRHICDSLQLVDLTETPERWLDIGSGGGFPGIVVAIFLQGRHPAAHVTLVESDTRKCVFLKTASRTLDVAVEIRPHRIETLEPWHATTLSARALAPLSRLIGHAHRHLAPGGTGIFPKGRNWKNELTQAKDKWSFDCDVIQSATDADAAILKLRNIQRI